MDRRFSAVYLCLTNKSNFLFRLLGTKYILFQKNTSLQTNGNSSSVLHHGRVAKILHLHTKTVRELIVKKKLGAIKIGTEYRISQDHLQKFIEENQV